MIRSLKKKNVTKKKNKKRCNTLKITQKANMLFFFFCLHLCCSINLLLIKIGNCLINCKYSPKKNVSG